MNIKTENKNGDNKQRLRGLTVGTAPIYNSRQYFCNIDGQNTEFKINDPSIRIRNDLSKKYQIFSAEQTDFLGFVVAACIECVVDPISGDQIWNQGDMDKLLNQPANGWFDNLGEEVMKAFNVDLGAKKNNSKETVNDSSYSE